MKVWVTLCAFIALQIIANLLFKAGSVFQKYYVHCFVIANVFGISSTWILMTVYKHMDANIAMALGGGISFLLVQFFLMALFGTKMAGSQWAGILMVIIGITLVTAGAKAG